METPRLNLDLSPTSLDPLGINKVSGFYGPGAWSGWFITMLCSFYNVARFKPRSSRLQDTIIFVLATNWAAIDFLRQMDLARQESDISRAEEYKGRIAAALLMTYIGLLFASPQIAVCLAVAYNCKDKRLSPRDIVLLMGSYIPSIALTSLYGFMARNVRSSNFEATHWENTLPAFAHDGIEAEFHARCLQAVALLGLIWTISMSLTLGSLLLHLGRAFLTKSQSRVSPPIIDLVYTNTGIAILLALIIYAFLSVDYDWGFFWICFAPLGFMAYIDLNFYVPLLLFLAHSMYHS
ncbi:hypothetical protein BDV96DRAFT_561441 [Lophiotrema nucula]|uniref:Uncharacterized protein n=1 Tax=Lophiotrema nucula TaxID=690887 RepID=A0A6A5ZVB5_9PLEO|nr:hypothetical protein BDV96DRAFT_561441 [Lophiotrema nucula]